MNELKIVNELSWIRIAGNFGYITFKKNQGVMRWIPSGYSVIITSISF